VLQTVLLLLVLLLRVPQPSCLSNIHAELLQAVLLLLLLLLLRLLLLRLLLVAPCQGGT
jgi:hypothetical protein